MSLPDHERLARFELCEGQVEVFDGFVDFGGVFVADGDAVNASIAEGEAHGGFAVFAIERAFSGEFHGEHELRDDAHAGYDYGVLCRDDENGYAQGNSGAVSPRGS